MNNLNFEELEKPLIKLRKYQSFLEQAKELGYKYLSQMIITEYFDNKKTTRQITSMLGTTTLAWLNDFFRTNKILARPTGVKVQMLSPSDDYKKIDDKLNIRDYENIIKVVNGLGYKTISECVIDLYFTKHFTFKEIGERLDRSSTWALYLIKKLNLQPRNSGGDNNKKLTEELKEKILKDMQNIQPTWENCRNYLATNNIKLSPKTIQRLLRTQKCQKSQDLVSM